ncbi:hypothetical protein Kfla_0402 [Kribbella flavida DSM 17836]|uniref:Polyketide cyclase/dehydrase n=1 Tax=Kribbella flavida (strain DSM 17836 / JCM 10339 / NBRC 14399) TaxID=479435 RepID=D2PUK8_KRIFD|nr:SRPBCC family protein [Kribbella flavida]ADB29526.1 hypothetical protein Kfla_0402 [Kribbella flavida DSM 17836]
MEQATSQIPASPDAIRHALLDALSLPEWNEAFLSIDGPARPTVGTPYALRVRPGFTGTLVYTVIEPDRVEMEWDVPGFHETGSWTLGPTGRVTHAFAQTGPLATVLRPAYRGIAAVRLDRLANRLAQLTRAA